MVISPFAVLAVPCPVCLSLSAPAPLPVERYLRPVFRQVGELLPLRKFRRPSVKSGNEPQLIVPSHWLQVLARFDHVPGS